MPITLLDGIADVRSGTAATVNLPLGTNWQPGDLRLFPLSTSSSRSYEAPPGWTVLYLSSASSGTNAPGNRTVAFLARELASGDTEPSVTIVGPAGPNIAHSGITLRGADNAAILASTPTLAYGGSSRSVSAPSVATGDGVLLTVHWVTRTDGTANTGSWGVPSGMTSRASSMSDGSMGYNILLASEARASGNSGQRTATAATAGSWTAASLFVPAAITVITHQASAALASSGSLTTGAAQGHRATAALTGAATATATASVATWAGATLAGAGELTTDATRVHPGAATLTGNSDLTATANAGQYAAANLTGSGSLTAQAGQQGTAHLTATSSLATDTWQTHAAATTLDGTGTLTTRAWQTHQAAAPLTATSSLTAAAARVQPITAHLTGQSALAATGTRVKISGADLHGDGTLGVGDVLRTVYPAAPLSGSGQLTATAAVTDGGGLNISVWAVDRQQGGRLVPLPRFVKVDVSDIANDAGAITLDYPSTGRGFDLLRRDVAADSDLEVEIWLGGRRDTAMRGYLDSASGDDVAEAGVWSFTGSLMPIRLAQAVIEPQDGDEKREFRAAAATPGELALLLHAQAQDRGVLTDISVDFTGSHDSDGVPWPELFTGKWSPGTTYLQWVQSLVELGLVETEVTAGKVWRLFVFGGRGTDRTGGLRPVTLRRGRNLGEAGRRATSRDAGTRFVVGGGEGVYTAVANQNALARRGRAVEVFSSVGTLDTPDALTAAAQRTAEYGSRGDDERSFALALGAGHPRPVQSFRVGDKVRVDTDGALGTERVAQWNLTSDPSGVSGSAITGDLIRSRQAALLARINAAESGQIIIGTSPTGEDTGVPRAPEGVVVGSAAFVDHLDVYSSVQVGWLPVEHNTDGTACTDLDGYRCEYALASSPDQWQFAFDVGPGRSSASFTALPGRTVFVRVQAYDRNGNASAWSDTAEHVTEDDTTPPPVTSAPSCSNFLGTLKITWDGLSDTGAEMHAAAPDFSYVEVHLSPASGFTPDDATLVGRLFGRGDYVVTDLPYEVTQFARLVAVDVRGNRAAPSGQGSAVPGKVVADDIFAGAVGSAALADLAVKRANIDNLAVNDAKIGDVSMGKVTAGQIKAAMIFTEGGVIGTRGAAGTGPGWEGDSAGIRFYNSAGTNTINFNAVTGGALVTGEYRTAMTGERFVINPGGANPDEIRFYPSSSNQYGYMQVVTSYSDVYGYQPGVQFKAHSGRGDGYAGQLAVFPDYASLSWGSSYVQVTPLLAGFSAPRFHFGINDPLGVGDNTFRLGFTDSNGFDDKTVISYHLNASREPSWRNINLGSGIAFGPGHIGAIKGDSSGYIPIRAHSFDLYTSLRSTKQDFADLDYEGGPLGALRAAPVQKWRRINEVADEGDAARIHVGPMADDLPPEVVSGDFETGDVGLSVSSLLGIVHAAVVQSADLNDDRHAALHVLIQQLTARIEQLEGAA